MHFPSIWSIRYRRKQGWTLCSSGQHHQRKDLHLSLVLVSWDNNYWSTLRWLLNLSRLTFLLFQHAQFVFYFRWVCTTYNFKEWQLWKWRLLWMRVTWFESILTKVFYVSNTKVFTFISLQTTEQNANDMQSKLLLLIGKKTLSMYKSLV